MNNHTIKLLLVDHEESEYILISQWISQFQIINCQLSWVKSYAAAIEAITHQEYDIYVLGLDNKSELWHQLIHNCLTSPLLLLMDQDQPEIELPKCKSRIVDYLERRKLNALLLESSIYNIIECQAEQKIHQQAALLDMATDAILVHDLDDKILFWNKAAENLYGWKKAAALQHKIQELWEEKDLSPLSAAANALKEHGSWQGELYQKTKSGQEIIVESRWSLYEFDQKVPSIIIVNSDITGKKRLEAQFFRAQRLESIGTLVTGITHDLNNVLTPILITAQLLESQMHDQRSRQLLPILIANAKRGAELVKQVLSFTRASMGDAYGGQSQRPYIQLKHLLLEIQQIVRETFPKSIEISTQIVPNLWAVSGDTTQLHQVLINLYINARDAMPHGGTLKISAENCTQIPIDGQAKPYVVISVTDSGNGIAPEIIDHIFEPFFTTKGPDEGTGLGLSTALEIIKNHGGFINVSSEVGSGSQFKIYLPAQNTDRGDQENNYTDSLD